jgi:hypothetical protein
MAVAICSIGDTIPPVLGVGVFDESFVLWRYRSGRAAGSEDPIHTSRYRRLLTELRKRSGDGAASALKAISKTCQISSMNDRNYGRCV